MCKRRYTTFVGTQVSMSQALILFFSIKVKTQRQQTSEANQYFPYMTGPLYTRNQRQCDISPNPSEVGIQSHPLVQDQLPVEQIRGEAESSLFTDGVERLLMFQSYIQTHTARTKLIQWVLKMLEHMKLERKKRSIQRRFQREGMGSRFYHNIFYVYIKF